MALISDLRNRERLTESEKLICRYILGHPGQISELSSWKLGDVTFPSAAAPSPDIHVRGLLVLR